MLQLYKSCIFVVKIYHYTLLGGEILNLKNNIIDKNDSLPSSSFHEWFDAIIKALIIILIILTFCFKVCTVVGGSMNNTLSNGDKLVITNFFYKPKENDIIVFHQTGEILNEPCVKRIIATGDKWVKIDYNTSTLYVSEDNVFDVDDIVDESSYAYFDIGSYKLSGTLETYVPKGYLFVMGDNRNNSTDSRATEIIGLVDEKTVLGKVILRISPSDKLGFIK